MTILEAKLEGEIQSPSIPLYHEVWNWEGDLVPLPHKWNSLIKDTYGKDTGNEWSIERFKREISQAEGFEPRGFFFLTSRSKTCGSVINRSLSDDPSIGSMEWLCCHPNNMNQGIEEALILLSLNYHKAMGRNAVRFKFVENLYGDKGIQPLLQKYGFAPV